MRIRKPEFVCDEELSDNILIRADGELSVYGEFLMYEGLDDPLAPMPFVPRQYKKSLDRHIRKHVKQRGREFRNAERRIAQGIKQLPLASIKDSCRLAFDDNSR
jgi:hypothetical protein